MGQLRITFWNDNVRVGKKALSAYRRNRHRSAAMIGHANYGQTLSTDPASDNLHVSLNGERDPRTITEEIPQLHTAGYLGHNRRVSIHHPGGHRDSTARHG